MCGSFQTKGYTVVLIYTIRIPEMLGHFLKFEYNEN